MGQPFNPAAWIARWTQIGGAYARTDAGLFLFWHDVEDAAARSELLAQCVSQSGTQELWLFLDPGRRAA